jgi:predicted GIY-YIG superfamily endonuclease
MPEVSFVYILRCSDGRLYIGHTRDIDAREQTHNEGRGAQFTAERRPVHVVYSESHSSETDAVARERQLKRWSAKKKEALVAQDWATLNRLSRRRKR